MIVHFMYTIYAVIFINLFAYVLMWYDKRQAIKKQTRIPEKQLFCIAFLFGALGIYLGMKAPLYHKAAKPMFKFGIPGLIVVNVFILILIFKILK